MEDEQAKKPRRRRRLFFNPKPSFLKKSTVLVFDNIDHSTAATTTPNINIHVNVKNSEGKYLIDKDDFVTLNKVMQDFPPLYIRTARGSRRYITGLDALKGVLQVAKEEDGSYKIIKLDLSRVEVLEKIPENRYVSLHNIRTIPEHIGRLTHLQGLHLGGTNIAFLSPKILIGLTNLKVLNLTYTRNLLYLPDEIGNLVNLQRLYLEYSGLSSLPGYPVLRKLTKLEELDLTGTEQLQLENTKSDDDDGDTHQRHDYLINLRKLNLRYSGILKEGSPSFFNDTTSKTFFLSSDLLCDLDLSGAKDLKCLPDEIRNLTNLERLNLSFTDISSLPPIVSSFYDKLGNLKVLCLTSNPILRNYPQQMKSSTSANNNTPVVRVPPPPPPPLRDLVRGRRCQCPLLGCIGLRQYQTKNFLVYQSLSHSLSLNRARSRIMSLFSNKSKEDKDKGTYNNNNKDHTINISSPSLFPLVLWPLVLCRAQPPFRSYPTCKDKVCDCQTLPRRVDAIFNLLILFSDEILVDRRRRPTTARVR